MAQKHSENNDYNPQLYTADRDDFCKSCYSTADSRAGCLRCIVWAVVVFLLFSVLKAKFMGDTAAAVCTAAVAAAAFASGIWRKRKK